MRWSLRKKRIPKKTKISTEQLNLEIEKKIALLKEMLEKILLTRKVKSGPLAEGKEWKLSKNSESLFKLEGPSANLLISTGPFLAVKKQRIIGLIEMDEVRLCRLLANPSNKIKDFLMQANNEKMSTLSHSIMNKYINAAEKKMTSLKILTESSFFQLSPSAVSLFIARVPMHLIAHSFVQFSDDYKKWLLPLLPYRYKLRLNEELEFLSSYRSEISDTPFYKVYPLLAFEKAVSEFWDKVNKAHILKS